VADPLQQRWYVVVNDLLGGWAVSNVDKPVHALMFPPHGEEYMIADMMDQRTAQHVRDLHNAWLLLPDSQEERSGD
jgi:hypothetical protein